MNPDIVRNPSVTAGILFSDHSMEASINRFLNHVLKFNCVSLNSFFDKYKRREAVELVQTVDFVIAEALQADAPVGFQFAKSVGKRMLIIFYHHDLEIETEGPFWLVLPEGMDRLSQKIRELLNAPVPGEEELENLEERFPILKDTTAHRWYLAKNNME